MKMEIGAVLPQNEIGEDTQAIESFAKRAEALGYGHLAALEHVLGAVHEGRDKPLSGRYDETTSFHEPLTLFSYLAAVTNAITFITTVLVSPQRQTALLAKQAAELDLLSRERFTLGIGVGWNHVEYESLGADFSVRGQIEEEQVALLRLFWTRPVVEFAGRFHRVDRAGLLPRPRRTIPIWLGGSTDAARRRAVRIADGFIVGLSRGPDGVAAARDAAQRAGRTIDDFGIQAFCHYGRGEANWKADLDALVEAGATRVALRTSDLGFDTSGHLRALERYASQVLA